MKEDFLKLYQDFKEDRNKRQQGMFENYGVNTPRLPEVTFIEFMEWLEK